MTTNRRKITREIELSTGRKASRVIGRILLILGIVGFILGVLFFGPLIMLSIGAMLISIPFLYIGRKRKETIIETEDQ